MIKILQYLILALPLLGCAQRKEAKEPNETLYSYQLRNIDGEKIDLAEFKGKKILFVNVASECGFTPQYEGLQELHSTYGDKLVVIGLPCNQFGGQEPGDVKEIKAFCKKNYGVDFLITEKIEVKGDGKHDIYKWLTQKSLNNNFDSSVKWNFQKYLVDENGNLIDVFYSVTKPMSKKIISLI